MAYFDNQDISFQLLAAGRKAGPEWFSTIVEDELSFNEAIRLLCDHALIEPLRVSNGYGMHSCVHDWALHILNAESETSMATLALICVGFAVPKKSVSEHWVTERRLLPHARKCLESVRGSFDLKSQGDENNLNAIYNLGALFYSQQYLAEAEAMYQWALEGNEKAWGPNQTSMLDTFNKLGILYERRGKMAEAEAMYRRVLEGKEKAWGPDHASTLDAVNDLGTIYADQGKMAEAEAMLRRALEGKEKAWGPDHFSTLKIVHNLGTLYWYQGKWAQSEAMFRRALEGNEKARGTEHASRADRLYYHGITYARQGKMAEAKSMYLLHLRELQWSGCGKSALPRAIMGKTTALDDRFLIFDFRFSGFGFQLPDFYFRHCFPEDSAPRHFSLRYSAHDDYFQRRCRLLRDYYQRC